MREKRGLLFTPFAQRLLLVLALLFSQLGGIAHGASHQHEQDKDRPHTCQLCAAYAAFEHAPPAADFALPVAASHVVIPLPARTGRTLAARPPYHSRAPPSPLA